MTFPDKGDTMKNIKAIGWDLDDTLYQRGDFYRSVFETMQQNVIKINHSFKEFYHIFEIQSDIEYEKFIREGKEKDDYQIDRVISTYNHFNYQISRDQAIIFTSLYFYYRNHLKLHNDVSNVFKHLIDSGYELFILTNGPSIDQRNKLSKLQIANWIPENRWFISEELNYSKPDIELFKQVEHTLGYQSHELAYIGDNYQNDIFGSTQAGWHAVHYFHPANNGKELNHPATIHHIKEVINLFS